MCFEYFARKIPGMNILQPLASAKPLVLNILPNSTKKEKKGEAPCRPHLIRSRPSPLLNRFPSLPSPRASSPGSSPRRLSPTSPPTSPPSLPSQQSHARVVQALQQALLAGGLSHSYCSRGLQAGPSYQVMPIANTPTCNRNPK